MTHPNGKRLKKDRGRCASQVENRLAESGADPMSPPLGATSGNFELDAIHRSGILSTGEHGFWNTTSRLEVTFSQPGGSVGKNWRLRVG